MTGADFFSCVSRLWRLHFRRSGRAGRHREFVGVGLKFLRLCEHDVAEPTGCSALAIASQLHAGGQWRGVAEPTFGGVRKARHTMKSQFTFARVAYGSVAIFFWMGGAGQVIVAFTRSVPSLAT